MSSRVMEYASEENNGSSNSSREDVDERFELLRAGCDPTASDLSLTPDDFLRAAVSLKDQVLLSTVSTVYTRCFSSNSCELVLFLLAIFECRTD